MKRIATIAVAVTFLLGAATAAQAELMGELGILDTSGNNPATGAPWTQGDQYRLAFHTSTDQRTTAVSTDISTYNAWVQGVAEASTVYDLSGATWKVIGSTADVAARDNTSTNPEVQGAGHAIFLLDGSTVVANDFDDLWDGTIQNPIGITELGTEWTHWPFTGTAQDGTPAPGPGANYGPLGSTGQVNQGQASGTTTWITRAWTGAGATSELPMYAMSDPLEVVPEPATLALLGLGGLGTLIARRRRK